MIADALFVNARVITMDPARPSAERFAVWKGRILGLDEEVDGLRAHRTVDLEGRTVVPGFVDAHTHLGWTGMRSISLNVRDERTKEGVLARITEEARSGSGGGLIEVTGYDQRDIGGAHVTAEELDRAAPGRAVWVKHMSGHLSVVNAAALAEADDRERVERALAAEGLLLEEEQELVSDLVLPYPIELLERALSIAGRQCLEDGVTACVDAGIGAGLASLSALELAAYQRLRERGELPVRVKLMPFHGVLHEVDGHPEDGMAAGIDLGITEGFGDERLVLGPVKFWFDGGMMARTAAFTHPYAGSENLGLLTDDAETRSRQVVAAHVSGWNVAIHAIGDAAIDAAIDALRAAAEAMPRDDARHRIEHGAVIREDQLAALRDLGVTIVAQPCFLWTSGDDFAEIMGAERTLQLYRGRSIVDAGIPYVASTDRPHVGTPLRAVQVLVERKSSTGRPLAPAEALTADEALRAFTITAAKVAGWDHAIGSLEPGKLADFVVLGADPRTVAPGEIGDIAVHRTYIEGDLVWEAEA